MIAYQETVINDLIVSINVWVQKKNAPGGFHPARQVMVRGAAQRG
jgi:hypothetical protein